MFTAGSLVGLTASSAATMDSISAATSGVALLPLSVLAHSCTSRRFRCSTVVGAPASSAFVDDPRTTTRRRWRPVAEGFRAMSREGARTRANDGGAAFARDMSPRIPELPTGCDDADRTSPRNFTSEHDLQSPVLRVARPAGRGEGAMADHGGDYRRGGVDGAGDASARPGLHDRRVYIGGIPFSIDDNDKLAELLHQRGIRDHESLKVPLNPEDGRPRGFAFASFASAAAATRCIEALDQTTVEGRLLSCKRSFVQDEHPRPAPGSAGYMEVRGVNKGESQWDVLARIQARYGVAIPAVGGAARRVAERGGGRARPRQLCRPRPPPPPTIPPARSSCPRSPRSPRWSVATRRARGRRRPGSDRRRRPSATTTTTTPRAPSAPPPGGPLQPGRRRRRGTKVLGTPRPAPKVLAEAKATREKASPKPRWSEASAGAVRKLRASGVFVMGDGDGDGDDGDDGDKESAPGVGTRSDERSRRAGEGRRRGVRGWPGWGARRGRRPSIVVDVKRAELAPSKVEEIRARAAAAAAKAAARAVGMS